MKITFEIPNKHLIELENFLNRNSAGHIKIAKKCIAQAYWDCIQGQLERGYDVSAAALHYYMKEMNTEYIRLKESELGYKLDNEDFIDILDKTVRK